MVTSISKHVFFQDEVIVAQTLYFWWNFILDVLNRLVMMMFHYLKLCFVYFSLQSCSSHTISARI